MTHSVPFRARLGRLFMVVALATGITIAGASSAQATSPLPSSLADLAVDLDADYDGPGLPWIRYNVSIANIGPQALESATVVVRLDPRAFNAETSPCTLDTGADTLTCSFGQLPVGATATLSTRIYFGAGYGYTEFTATATRTDSAPLDPNSANDTDIATCEWDGGTGPGLVPRWMYC